MWLGGRGAERSEGRVRLRRREWREVVSERESRGAGEPARERRRRCRARGATRGEQGREQRVRGASPQHYSATTRDQKAWLDPNTHADAPRSPGPARLHPLPPAARPPSPHARHTLSAPYILASCHSPPRPNKQASKHINKQAIDIPELHHEDSFPPPPQRGS